MHTYVCLCARGSSRTPLDVNFRVRRDHRLSEASDEIIWPREGQGSKAARISVHVYDMYIYGLIYEYVRIYVHWNFVYSFGFEESVGRLILPSLLRKILCV